MAAFIIIIMSYQIEAAVQFLIIIIPFPFDVMHGSAGRFIII